MNCGSVSTDGALEVAKCYEACSRKFVDFQRMRKFEEVTGLQADEVSIILDFFGKFNYQDDVPMQPIYAPPVEACLECGSRLVANHSCSIRNYGTQGLCIGEKFTLCCPGLLIICDPVCENGT